MNSDVLDIGCGSNPLFFKGEVVHADLSGEHLEVKCDAHHLPFRDNSFKIVYASHLIEHCLDPRKVLEECKRVSSKCVIIKVINAKVDYACETHFYSWNELTLENFLKAFFKEVNIYHSLRVTPHKDIFRKVLSQLKVFALFGIFGKNELTAI
ncbi:MAG: class I SAM-dependent methyltransferase [Nitrososphaerota archaeon]